MDITDGDVESDDSQPIACQLSEDAQKRREEQLSGELFDRIEAIEECEDGYVFTFPGTDAALTTVCTFIQTERVCCPFFRFELDVAPARGQLRLRLSGPDGTRQFIENDLLSEM